MRTPPAPAVFSLDFAYPAAILSPTVRRLSCAPSPRTADASVGQQQPVAPRMFDQPTPGLHQPLL
jgi:hypothetical protein